MKNNSKVVDVGEESLALAANAEDIRASQMVSQRNISEGSHKLSELINKSQPIQLEESLQKRAPNGTMSRLLRAILQGLQILSPNSSQQQQNNEIKRERAIQSVVEVICKGKDPNEEDATACFSLLLSELDTIDARVAMMVCETSVDACIGVGSSELWEKHKGKPLNLIQKCLIVVQNAADRFEIETPKPSSTSTAAAAIQASPSLVVVDDVDDEIDEKKKDKKRKRERKEDKDGDDEESAAKKQKKQLSALKEFKAMIITKFCEENWPKNGLPKILETLRGLDLDKEQHLSVSQKAVLELKQTCEVQQLFAFVYQMLCLTENGHCNIIMSGIASHFNTLESNAIQQQLKEEDSKLKSLREAESSVFFNVNMAANSDEGLAKEFLKLLKNNHKLISPFTITLALSIAHSPRLVGSVFSALLTIVSENNETKNKIPDWAISIITPHKSEKEEESEEEKMKDEEKEKEQRFKELTIDESFLEVSRLSAISWDFVTESMINFAFHLLDYVGIKSSSKLVSPGSLLRLKTLGKKILVSMFNQHGTAVQGALIENSCNRIASQGSGASLFVDVVRTMTEENPRAVSPFGSKLRLVLENLPKLPPQSVSLFLSAVKTLLEMDHSLLDVAVISLRKALFGKDIIGRVASVSGLCQLIQSSSSKEKQQQQNSNNNSTDLVAEKSILLHEIFGLLQRALDQQYEVKSELFKDISLMAISTPTLAQQATDILLPHFLSLCNKDNDTVPIRINECIQGKTLLQPLATLISSLGKIASIDTEHCKPRILREVDVILGKVVNTNIDSFGVVDPDENEEDEISPQKRLKLSLLIDIYTSFIDYKVLSDPNLSQNTVDTILRLNDRIIEVNGIINPKAKGKDSTKGKDKLKGTKQTKSKDKDKSAQKEEKKKTNPTALLSTQSTSRLLHAIFDITNGDGKNNKPEHFTALISNTNFRSFITDTCITLLKQLSENQEGDSDESKTKCKDFCFDVAPLFCKGVIVPVFGIGPVPKDPIGLPKSILQIACDIMELCIHFMLNSQEKTTLESFISSCLSDDKEDDDSAVNLFVQKLEGCLTKLFDDKRIKEAESLSRLISELSSALSKDTFSVHCNNLKKIFKYEIPSLAVIKDLMIVFFRLSSKINGIVDLVNVAQELREIFDSVNESSDFKIKDKQFPAITEKTAVNVSYALLIVGQEILDDIEWVISHITESITSRNKLYKSINDVLDCSIHLICSKLPQKIATKFSQFMNSLFKLLTAVTKEATRFITEQTNSQKKNKKQKKNTEKEDSVIDKLKELKILLKHSGVIIRRCNSFLDYLNDKDEIKDTKSKISSDSKNVPLLIYSIEMFEVEVMTLSSKSHHDFSKHIPRTEAHGFKFKIEAIQDGENTSTSNKDKEDDEEMKDEDEEENEEKEETKKDEKKKHHHKHKHHHHHHKKGKSDNEEEDNDGENDDE